MPEPSRPGLRPTGMVRALMMAVLLVLAGCGSAEESTGGSPDKSSASPSSSSTVVACAHGVGEGRLLTKADVDGNGSSDEIRSKTDSAQRCSALLADTRTSGSPLIASVPDDEPPVTSAFAVAPPGQDAQWVVTRADHPRGGYQLRVYAATPRELVELTSGGQPLLPFVATDVQEHPWSVDCSDGGLVLTEAVPHEPVGVVPAWDIRQTTYAVDGGTVTRGATKEVADNVLHQDLAKKYPELAKHSAFASCRV